VIDQAHCREFVTAAFRFRLLAILLAWGFFEGMKATKAPWVAGTTPLALHLNIWALRVICFTAAGLVLPYHWLTRRYPAREDLSRMGLIGADMLLVTALIHYVGGIHSSAYGCLYVFIILFAAGLFEGRKILVVTGLCSLAYFTLFYLELQGLLPSQVNPGTEVNLQAYLIRLFCVEGFLWGFGLAAVRLAHRYQRGTEVMLLGSALTGLAHELRTPLSVIASEVTTSRLQNTQPNYEAIGDQINLMGALFDDLCRYGTYHAEDVEPVNLVDIVDQAVSDVYKCLDDARKEEVQVIRDYSSKKIMIEGDPWNFQRAVVNIVRNAVESLSVRGEVKVTVKKYVACAQVEVQDNGKGIEKRDLEKIFDPFFSTKRHRGGNGLGLALTKKIIDEHGGNIRVESQGTEGTRVIVRMPHIQDGRGGENEAD